MAEDFVLSASSLNTFLRCGRQWEYAYVFGIKAPPSLRASRGIAVHTAVETNMRQKMSTLQDLPLADVLDAFADDYDKVIADGYEARPDETAGSVKDGGIALTKIHHSEVAPNIQPVLVEHPIQFTINDQLVWTGQIDLADRVAVNLWGEPNMKLRVRDTKTTGRAPKPEQYKLNMVGYSVGVRQGLGEEEADVVFDYLVATQKPYYLPIHTGKTTDAQIQAFAELAIDVANTIKRGSFPANGLTNPGVCDWCGYRMMCSAYKIKDPNA